MTDTVLVALISSGATLLAVYLKLKLDKEKNKKTEKETKILLEDLHAKKATIILREDDSDFDFISESSTDMGRGTLFRFPINDNLGFLELSFKDPVVISEENQRKIKNYTNLLSRILS
tara:strand:- start:98 stop:451 length:354 start_codon:yes stop_codon:yes gene_type:complete